MSKLAWTLKEMKKNYVAYLMVAPFYIIFLLFTVVPVVLSLVLSFTSFNTEWLPKDFSRWDTSKILFSCVLFSETVCS